VGFRGLTTSAPVASSNDNDDKPSGFIKGGEFPE
jgi:hypothetical protein